MKTRKNTSVRPGAALLIVLFIVMAITITALGFVSQSDVELACGQNMVLRRQMDYLAESGLEHARGLILNPQDASSEYWTGSTGLQLVSGSNYYDVTVLRDPNDRCNYTIDCSSYRLNGTETTGRSSLRAVLRIDPCIAYWVDSNTTVRPLMMITGDVYCGGNLTNSGTIDGDVFATHLGGANSPSGQLKPVSEAGVSWPNLAIVDFGPTYTLIDPNNGTLSQPVYPPGVYYSVGDVNMPGNVTVNGTLVVGGKLTVSGPNNVITAAKNFPALVVTGQVVMKQGSALAVNGLAQIGQGISIDAGATSATIQVTGGLFVWTGGVVSDAISVSVVAAPEIASIEVSPAGVSRRWGPAGGAFFRSIARTP